MRSRKSSNDQVAEVARRRLELLSAELAEIRRDPTGPPTPGRSDGSGEPLAPPAAVTGGRVAEDRSRRPGRHARRSGAAAGGRVTGWLHDRLPATLQGRVRLGASQLSLLAVVVAVAMGVLAWWTVRATDAGQLVSTGAITRQQPESVQPLVTPSTAPSSGQSTGPSAGSAPVASSDGMIIVDVAGKVRDPGIARLPTGSRVVDAVRAAGGARRGVDLGSLNLARVLVDGEQVLVGVPQPTAVVPSAAAAAPGSAGMGGLVSINRADQAALESLPGVGPVTAQAILQWRVEHGAFSAVEELLEVSGIGDATLAEIAPFVTL